MRPYSWLLAQCYDLAMSRTERLCLHNWRRELLATANGEVLEIGAGTGGNLQYFPGHCHLTLSEPDAHMRRKLQRKLREHQITANVAPWPAEKLDLPAHSIDTVISTLVLCSVSNPQQVLKEIYRVLRPGGQLLFIEHVRSDNHRTVRWQKLCEPTWRCLCGNCHLTRDTLGKIQEQGMLIDTLSEADLCGAPAIVRRTLRGKALKPTLVDFQEQAP